MRVLFVISTLRMGGAERVCAVMASKFSQEHDVTLAKFDAGEPFYKLDERVEVLNLAYGADEAGLVGNLKKRFGKIFGLRNLIKNGKFNAVISFLDSTNALVLIASIGLKTPIIISEHTSIDMPKARIYEILKRILYPSAQALSVLTHADAQHYAKFCKNVRVIYNPNFSQNSLKTDVQKENLVLFVGRLTAVKNCEMFVRVAANLKEYGFKFVVAGDGDERRNLENLALEFGANVEFFGNVADVGTLYERAKVLVSTSRIEGLGNTLIEAIGHSVARVATKTSGACELIKDGFDGLLCEQDDDKAMSEIVLNLMQNESDRARICTNAYKKIGEFSLDKIYEKWLELLKLADV